MRVPRSWRFVAAALAIAGISCDNLPTDNTGAFERSDAVTVIDGFTVARDNIPMPQPTLSASSTFGPAGGTLNILGHSLTVPAGAVTNPTRFTMEVQPSGLIEVDLTAVEFPGTAFEQQITQFSKPIQLSLSYARSRDRSIMRQSGVIINVDGTEATPIRTRIRPTQRRVVAGLWHFSRYMMASN